MNLEVVSTLISAIAILIGVITYYVQSRTTHFLTKLEYLWRLEQRFTSDEELLKNRLYASRALLKGQNCAEVDEILNFFESVGMHLKLNALDKQMVWHSFDHWAVRYWYGAQDYVKQVRQQDPTIWIHCDYLVHELTKFGQRNKLYGVSSFPPSQDDLQQFFSEEIERLQSTRNA